MTSTFWLKFCLFPPWEVLTVSFTVSWSSSRIYCTKEPVFLFGRCHLYLHFHEVFLFGHSYLLILSAGCLLYSKRFGFLTSSPETGWQHLHVLTRVVVSSSVLWKQFMPYWKASQLSRHIMKSGLFPVLILWGIPQFYCTSWFLLMKNKTFFKTKFTLSLLVNGLVCRKRGREGSGEEGNPVRWEPSL